MAFRALQSSTASEEFGVIQCERGFIVEKRNKRKSNRQNQINEDLNKNNKGENNETSTKNLGQAMWVQVLLTFQVDTGSFG